MYLKKDIFPLAFLFLNQIAKKLLKREIFMKNRINWIIVTIVTISLLFSFIGCKDPDPIELDQTAPAEVTNLTVTASNGNAVVTWENPSDLDLAGVQVAMSPAEGTLANAVSLGKDVTSLNVSGLKVGSEYTELKSIK